MILFLGLGPKNKVNERRKKKKREKAIIMAFLVRAAAGIIKQTLNYVIKYTVEYVCNYSFAK